MVTRMLAGIILFWVNVRAPMAHNLAVDECLALLKDASLKPESIAEEMECAGVERPQPAQVQAARDALARLDSAAAIAALPEMLALALVHAPGRAARHGARRRRAQGP